jgi:predicted nucleic acid-binding protein
LVTYLLDTMVLSELRKREKNAGLAAWIAEQRDADLFVSVISIGELERGIGSVAKKDAAFAGALGMWLDKLLMVYGDRILPVSLACSRRWGLLSAACGNAGADVLLAATALEHDCTIVTRNIRHFDPTGARTYNPWT